MSLSNYSRILTRNLQNIPGWHTNRKIIIFESDDWGSIRMPSKDTYTRLLNYGVPVNNCQYNSNDSLATEYDLKLLFELLGSIRDKNNTNPILTANCIVANPDFKKIRESNFRNYHYEIFTETLKRYAGCSNSFEIWQEGIKSKLFFPQFHGREHLNVSRWMMALQSGYAESRFAFDLDLFGLSTNITNESRKSFLAALDFDELREKENQLEILKDGLQLFNKIFGYKSQSFIATNYVWYNEVENMLDEQGVKFIKSAVTQTIPNSKKRKLHFTGQRNSLGQIYIQRNCNFEPSFNPSKDWIRSCLSEIEIAFNWHKPAIISTHRVNFIGAINSSNRDQTLKLFRELLIKIVTRWPEVEFFNTVQLGELICNNKE